METQAIYERYKLAKQRRLMWEDMWEDCIDYAMPARQSFYDRTVGNERTQRVFDETAISATAEFASRMQGAIIPPGRKWFRFKVAETLEPAQRKELQGDLDKLSDYLYMQFMRSNLDTEVHENFMDIAIGTCALSCELDSLNRLIFRAAPLPTFWIEEGPDGRVGGVFRCRPNIEGFKIKAEFPSANIDDDDKNTYDIIEATVRDYREKTKEVYHYKVWIEATNQVLKSAEYSGWGSNPWIVARWAETADEWWGRGPLINILPAIRGANLTRELIFENAEMAIGGVYTYVNDGTINPEQLQIAPNTFIPVAPGSDGLRPLDSSVRFDVAENNLQDLRYTIKRGLFSEDYTPTGKTPLSAQEVSVRQADLANRIGSPFARVMKELVEPIVMRAARLYSDAGLIEIPEIDGKTISIVPVSPLARAQNVEDITRMSNFIGTVVNFMGPEAAGSYLNTDLTIQMMAELYEFPMEMLLDNDGRVEQAEQAQDLQAKLQTALRTMPQTESRQVIEKGPMQPEI